MAKTTPMKRHMRVVREQRKRVRKMRMAFARNRTRQFDKGPKEKS